MLGIDNNLLMTLLPLVIAFGFIYFFMVRPQKKREAEVSEMRSALKLGDHVLTVGGLKGEIIALGTNYLTLETAGSTKIELTRSAVYKVLSPEETVDQD